MAQSAEELRREIANTRADLSGTLDAIGDRVSPGRVIERRKNRMSSGVRSMRDRVMGTAHDTSLTMRNEAHALGGSLADKKEHAVTAIKDTPTMVAEKTEGTPMVAGAIAFGLGFLAAAAFPASRAETRAGATMLDKVEPMKAELSNVGQEMAQHLKEPVAQAASAMKEAATDSAHTVTDTAKGAAQETRDHATSAVDAVKTTGS